MGILSRLFNTRASVTPGTKLSNPSSWLIDLLGGSDSTTGIKVTEDNALTSSAVWACVRALAEGMATLPLHVYRQYPSGSKEKVPDYPLYPVLHDQPNPEMTSVEWREASMGHLLLWGNSYSEIEFDQAMRPVALWPLRPDRMQMWRDPQTGDLVYIYSLYSGGGNAWFGKEQILHIRTLGRDGLLGLSPIGQMREAIGLSLAMERYGGALFGNGAQPGGVLTTDGVLSEKAQENLRNSWENTHRGPGNAGRVAVLEQGVHWQAIGMPPEDAQFIMSRQFSLQEIARIYRMPPHLIQDLSRSTNNNIEQQSLEYVIHTLRPYLVRYEQAFQSRLFPGRDQKRYYALFAVDGLLRGDLASRYAAYAVGRQWGWLSADDIREKEDMNPLPDGLGQEYLKPLNMVDAGTKLPIVQNQPPDDNKGGSSNGGDNKGDGSGGGGQQAARMLEAFLEDVGRRLVAREDADICRAARKLQARRRWAELPIWLEGFYQEHRQFIAQQALPAFRVLDPELADELAQEFAGRHLDELRDYLGSSEDLVGLEARLETWETERPPQLAERECKRALRRGWEQANGEHNALVAMSEALIKLAEPRQAQPLHLHQAPITVQPAEVRIAEGAIQNHLAPSPVNIHEGAMQTTVEAPPPAEVRVEVQPPPPADVRVEIAPPPPAEFRMEEGAVQVEVAAPPAPPPAEVKVEVQAPPAPPPAEVRIENHPPEVRIEPAEVKVEVQAPPAPPPAEVRIENHPPEVRIEPGAVQVDVAAPPAQPAPEVNVTVEPPLPTQVTIAEGAVQTTVQAPPAQLAPEVNVTVEPPPPTQVNIAEGAVQTTVQAPPPAEVKVEVQPPPPAELRVEEGAVNVTVAPPPPQPAPQVTFEKGAIQLEQPKAPKPRLARAKAEETEKKTQALRQRRKPPQKRS